MQVLLLLLLVVLVSHITHACNPSNCFEDYLTKNLSNNKTIDIYYICYYNPNRVNYNTLAILLQGGPGGSSDGVLVELIEEFNSIDSESIFCTTDYRGVGRSSELRCSDQTQYECDSYPNCQDEISQRFNLDDFYTNEAAKDVIDIVLKLKSVFNIQQVSLYGVSYGTFWLQKIMQINNSIAQNWIFDGVVLQPWFEYGGWFGNAIEKNNLVIDFINTCINHTKCRKYLTIDDLNHIGEYIMQDTPLNQLKQFISNKIYQIFANPMSMDNHQIYLIKFLLDLRNELYSNSLLQKRSFCEDNHIVYMTVKANELYNDNYYDYFNIANDLFYDSITDDIYGTVPWINEIVRDYRPINTSGNVLVLGGYLDIQTPHQNSDRLHEYFIANKVNSKVLKARYGHAVILLNYHSNKCGLDICHEFLTTGNIIDATCLDHSDLITFDTADYSEFHRFVPPEESQLIITEEIDPAKVAMIVIIVLLICVVVMLIIAFRMKERIVNRFWIKARANEIQLNQINN